VSITPTASGWALGYEGVENFQDVSISGLALVDVSGVGGGEVQVRGADVTIAGSSIFAATRGNINGGEILIGAEQLNIQENSLVGGIATEGSSGNSGDVTVETNSLNIENSGIFSIGLSEGNSGDITVKAQAGSVELTGTIADERLPAGLTAGTTSDGTGGTVMVKTGQLIARDGAGASVTAGGAGNAGDVIVTASESIELIGESTNGQFVSGLFANSFGTGAAGNLEIESGRLIVRDGATITATTRRGRGGNVSVTALEFIEVSGTTRDRLFESNLASFAIGGEEVGEELQGGDLQINTRRLRVSDGAQISVSGFGTGQGGTVEVTASESIELIGQSADGRFKSGLFAEASLFPEPFDNIDRPRRAGNLTISTGELIIRDGSEITVSGEGLGAPGNISVTANSIHLDNQGGVTAESLSTEGGNIELNISDSLLLQNNSGVSTSTFDGVGGILSIKTPKSVIIDSESRLLSEATGDGTAGSLEISTNQLRVQADSSVAVSSSGTGDAGSLNINAGKISLERSNISARTFSGGQGNIQLRLDDSISLNNSTVSASTVEGAGGTVTVNAQNRVNIENGSELSSAATAKGTAGSLTVTTNQLRVQADSSVAVSSAETGDAGSLNINAGNVSLERSNISARTVSGGQGNIQLRLDDSISLDNSTVSASTVEGAGGTVTVNAQNAVSIENGSELSSAATGNNGTAGSLSVATNQLRVNAGSSVEVSSVETGSAGNLRVDASKISLNNGTFDARTASGNQGNITLNASEDIQLRNSSAINTNATGTATGGNIFINTDFVIAFPGNSDITANAIQGDGGRIEITADEILGIEQRGELTPENDITVTSTFGSSGEVIFNIPDVGALQGTENLSENAVDPEEAVPQACGTDSEDENSFTVIGRGGVPRGPQDPLVSDTMGVGGERSSQAAPTKPPIPIVTLVEDTEPISIEDIVPARGWIVDEDGIVELTAYPTPYTSDRPFPRPVRCPRKK